MHYQQNDLPPALLAEWLIFYLPPALLAKWPVFYLPPALLVKWPVFYLLPALLAKWPVFYPLPALLAKWPVFYLPPALLAKWPVFYLLPALLAVRISTDSELSRRSCRGSNLPIMSVALDHWAVESLTWWDRSGISGQDPAASFWGHVTGHINRAIQKRTHHESLMVSTFNGSQ